MDKDYFFHWNSQFSMPLIPYPWNGDGRCNLGLAGRVRVVCNPVVYGDKTAESQSARRTNDGDDYYSEANMLFLSSFGNKGDFMSLRLIIVRIRLASLCILCGFVPLWFSFFGVRMMN